jgi:hypothetical protein
MYQPSLLPVSQSPLASRLPASVGQGSRVVVVVVEMVVVSVAVTEHVAVTTWVTVARSVCVTVCMAVTKIVATADSVAIIEFVFIILDVLVTVMETVAVLRIVVGGGNAFRMQEQALESLDDGYVCQPGVVETALSLIGAGSMIGVVTARGKSVLLAEVPVVRVIVSVIVVVWL